MVWQPVEMIASQWLLSVSLKLNGEEYPHYTLIDRRRQKSTKFNNYKHCLQKPVAEKLAMLKLLRGNYDHHFIGSWIGDRQLVVALNKDEYNELLERLSGTDTGTQGKNPRKKDTK